MNVLIIDDDETLGDLVQRELARGGHRVTIARSGGEGLRGVAEADPDVVLLDLMLPDVSGIDVLEKLRAERPATQVVVFTAHGTVDTAISAMKLGAYDYLQKPCHLDDLEITLRRACERRRLGEENARLRAGLRTPEGGSDLVGCGPAFAELLRFISRVGASESTVLVRGETGTGKELVARSIHRSSPRKDEPFVVVDCAALHESLLQSELFGHEKGAFTGASRLRYGLFEAADRGTVFLDEVGDVSPAVQAGLLRVLESSSFRRLGGTREVKVDVRLIAATNRDLEGLMAAGRFRQDLYFRVNTIHIEMVPLRRRQEEIPSLVEHFLGLHAARTGRRQGPTPEAIEALKRYEWPGNVRELRHVLERSLVLADGDAIGLADLPLEVRRRAPRVAHPSLPSALPLQEVERRHIAGVLADVGGHRTRAAELLGISERSLYRKIREYGLDAASNGSEE